MDINYDSKITSIQKNESNLEQDSEDILKQISQIIQSEDRSFDSPVIFTKTQTLFHDYNVDLNQIAKDYNILEKFEENYKRENYKKEKSLDLNLNENDLLKNNKQITLNQKLKYLCSLIQISNINIRKYDDLKQFNKYLEDKNSVMNYFEPINLLFDIINELILVIQKELRNNDMLMKELKRYRKIRNEDENTIYKLKMDIKDKDRQLNELITIKSDEYYKYNSNEINELKNENKELYKKIYTYKSQIKKVETDNNEMRNKLKLFNTEKLNFKKKRSSLFNSIKYNKNNNSENYFSIPNLNNNENNNDMHCSLQKKNDNINEIKTINNRRNFSASKSLVNYKTLSQRINANYDNNNNNNSNNSRCFNGRSIITNIMFLLKEINEMLNIYNNSLSEIKFLNNTNMNKIPNVRKDSKDNKENQFFVENNNVKCINSLFMNKLNNTIKKIELYIKNENNKKLNNEKKLIYVNTSKFKLRRKSNAKKEENKNEKKNKENDNNSLNLSNKKNIKNSNNLELTDKFNCTNTEENNFKKIFENITHDSVSSYVYTDSLNQN